jgi:hypothetical protein
VGIRAKQHSHDLISSFSQIYNIFWRLSAAIVEFIRNDEFEMGVQSAEIQ